MKPRNFLLTIWTILAGVFSASGHAFAAEKPVKNDAAVAYLAGGCFWGMEDLLRKLPGVTKTEVGYMGGKVANATYDIVKTGISNHAETVKVEFNPEQLSYENLLLYFFKIHDPTTLNRQGNDVGTQYRSEIFYTSDEQKETAFRVIARVNKSKAWGKDVSTVVGKAGEFWKAEDYHQDYLQKNPDGYTCHFVRKVDF
ncbi:peptide-methionine (S)-S-oxide reductase MsrA [Bdellovibrio sp. HCB274]|uniref:peptide-methionine (S)-S-oxide reductase MsrA n=1 Tax=Bdellovibrio sp. HCB274 TaxID=3394361 RepID=UPI0039B3E014